MLNLKITKIMRRFIFKHTSFETAYEVKNYPYGRLRTSIFFWIETTPKRGDRFCSCTINPKNGRVNAPKKGTYSNLAFMFLDDNSHVKHACVEIGTRPEVINALIEEVGIENLNEEQKVMLKQLRGEKIERALIKGQDFKIKIKYEKTPDSGISEARITFDRPDGVSVNEIFNAIKSIPPATLAKVWEGWESKTFGRMAGFVRICTRGGAQLTIVREPEYKELSALDEVNNKEG